MRQDALKELTSQSADRLTNRQTSKSINIMQTSHFFGVVMRNLEPTRPNTQCDCGMHNNEGGFRMIPSMSNIVCDNA